MQVIQFVIILALGLFLTLSVWLVKRAFSRAKNFEEDNRKLDKKILEQEQVIFELEKSRKAALESAQLRFESLANASHEIRTPLSGIVNISKLLFNSNLTDRQRQNYVETLQSSSTSLINILDDILDFSKIEAGKLRLENIKFGLTYVIDSVIRLLSKSAEAKGIRLEYSVDKDVPSSLYGDPGRLRQVLTNLIGNAVKFTDEGSVQLFVTIKSETAQKIIVLFEIRDTGIGVAENARHLLFSPFTQVDSSIARRYGGTGLGLSISKHIAEHMGGEIGVNFPDDRGSTFWFTASFEKQQEIISKQQQSFIFHSGLRGLYILIADCDEDSNRKLVQQAESWNMQVFEADSAHKALEMLRSTSGGSESFDFVLVGEQLPDMDPFSFARAVKADEDMAQTCLILLPSFTERGQGLLARESGFAAYLPKPIVPTQLFECLLNLADNDFGQESKESAVNSPFITQHTLAEIKQQTAEAGTSVLIVDDSNINQEVLANMVVLLGLVPDVKSNGYDALKALDERNYKFVLMDCQMPGITGYETTQRIRAGESKNKNVPIIAVTAGTSNEERAKCLAAGMNDYLVKPIDIEDLQFVLERWDPNKTNNGAGKTADVSDKKPPPVDLQRLKKISGNTKEGLCNFIDKYLQEMSNNISHLDKAVSARSGKKTAYYAHACLGISAICGINVLDADLRKMEDLGRSDDFSSITELHENFKTQFEEVRGYLKKLVNTELQQ